MKKWNIRAGCILCILLLGICVPASVNAQEDDTPSWTVALSSDTAVFTGDPVYPKLTVMDGDGVTELKKGTDYKVSDSGNTVRAGNTVTLTVTGLGAYEGLIETLQYNILPRPFTKEEFTAQFLISLSEYSYAFTGGEIKPEVKVEWLGHTRRDQDGNVSQWLLPGDFYVTYENNKNVGQAKAVIHGQNSFTGTLELPFRIHKMEIEGYTVLSSLEKSGKVILDSMTEDVDYTVQMIDEGNYAIVTLTGARENCCFKSMGKKVTAVRVYDWNTSLRLDWPTGEEIVESDAGDTYVPVCTTHSMNIYQSYMRASCTTDGRKAGYRCTRCGLRSFDAEGKEEMLHESDALIPALGHDWGEWIITYDGVKVRRCKNDPSHEQIDESYQAGNTGRGSTDSQGGNEVSGGSTSSGGDVSSGDTSSESGSGSGLGVTVPKVAAVRGFQVKAGKKTAKTKTLTLTWKKVSKADGYQIQFSTKKSFKGTKTIDIKKEKTRYKATKLNRKKYYVRIRAYRRYNDQKGKTKKAFGLWTVVRK